MGCNCKTGKTAATAAETKTTAEAPAPSEPEKKTLPTEQCIACAQKHMDEAYCLFTEYGYGNENRRLVRGNLRAIVLHTFKDWPEIATLARECALLIQEAKDAEALPKMKTLGDMIDAEFLKANTEIEARLEELQK